MHLVLALDSGFEGLSVVSLASFLLHHDFESVVVVSPVGDPLHRLEQVAKEFGVPLRWQTIGTDSILQSLPLEIRPFFRIEALQQRQPGRYLYVDADTLCVSDLSGLEDLPLDLSKPLAACSHGRPMPDRSLVLDLESPYHYFNAGVMLFDSSALLVNQITPAAVVDFYFKHRALCRFREQCALNGLMRGQVQFLPGQYNLLSWMRERQSQGRWHNVAANPMAYCLPDVWKRMAIVHLSAGALPTEVEPSRHERVDVIGCIQHHCLRDSRWLSSRSATGDGEKLSLCDREMGFQEAVGFFRGWPGCGTAAGGGNGLK